jgi:hypothetical protein
MTITTQQGEFALAVQWGRFEDGFPHAIKAQAKVTFLSQPSDADTLTIDSIAYRFKTVPAAAGDVKIGATLADTLANLLSALKGTANGNYFAATRQGLNVNADLGTASLFLEAFVPGTTGNSITLSQSGGSTGRYTLTAFAGGMNGGAARNAYGRIDIAAMPLDTETLTVGAVTYTFSTSSNAGNNIKIDAAGQNTPVLLAATIAVRLATNVAVTSIVAEGNQVSFRAVTAGAAGNSVVLSETVVDAAAVRVTGSGTFTAGADAAAFKRDSLTWYRIPTRDVDYGVNQMQETLPLEIGSTMTPKGAYKQGVNIQGGAQILPRLENSIGILLLASLGKATTTVPSTGVGQHIFTFQTNEINQPWLAGRTMIPGRDEVFGNGVVGYDNKVNLIRTTVAAASPVEMMLQLMGRFPEMDNHPETWTGQSFEDFKSIPLACKGTFKLPTVDGLPSPLPVTQVVVEMANVTTTPREEMIVGSYYMDDVVARTRVMTIRFVYKWKDAGLANLLFGSSLKSTAWSPTPFVTEVSGSNYAFDLLVESPYNITGTSTPSSLRIRANSCFWQPQPMRQRAGDIVTMEIIGTVLYNAAGYVEFVLTNGNTTGYTVPSEP